MPICKICLTSFPNHIMIDGKVKNVQNRRFCIQCSPFGKHNTRQLDQLSPVHMNKKNCPRCKTEKPGNEFYKRRKGNDFSVYCKRCTSEETIERQHKFKEKCVQYKGGKCQHCGYSQCNAAMEFHHIDPTKKDFTISHSKLTSFNLSIMTELDKCVLLCCRCHREEHQKMVGILGLEPRIQN